MSQFVGPLARAKMLMQLVPDLETANVTKDLSSSQGGNEEASINNASVIAQNISGSDLVEDAAPGTMSPVKLAPNESAGSGKVGLLERTTMQETNNDNSFSEAAGIESDDKVENISSQQTRSDNKKSESNQVDQTKSVPNDHSCEEPTAIVQEQPFSRTSSANNEETAIADDPHSSTDDEREESSAPRLYPQKPTNQIQDRITSEESSGEEGSIDEVSQQCKEKPIDPDEKKSTSKALKFICEQDEDIWMEQKSQLHRKKAASISKEVSSMEELSSNKASPQKTELSKKDKYQDCSSSEELSKSSTQKAAIIKQATSSSADSSSEDDAVPVTQSSPQKAAITKQGKKQVTSSSGESSSEDDAVPVKQPDSKNALSSPEKAAITKQGKKQPTSSSEETSSEDDAVPVNQPVSQNSQSSPQKAAITKQGKKQGTSSSEESKNRPRKQIKKRQKLQCSTDVKDEVLKAKGPPEKKTKLVDSSKPLNPKLKTLSRVSTNQAKVGQLKAAENVTSSSSSSTDSESEAADMKKHGLMKPSVPFR